MSHKNTRHGHRKDYKATKTWNSWYGMRMRCKNKNLDNYKYYGGRGIKVDERWEQFENFLADMGERPEGMTLDREDVDGDYGPDNCRWATHSDQMKNQRKRKPKKCKNCGNDCILGNGKNAAPLGLCTACYVFLRKHGQRRSEEAIRDHVAASAIKRGKKVVQCDPDGGEIKTWPTIAMASRGTGAQSGSIWRCISGRGKTAGGFRWRLASSPSP